MLYQQLARQTQARPVRVAVIGAGKFGSGIVRHSAFTPGLQVCAVADADLEAAQKAYARAGVEPARVAVCEAPAAARAALEAGQRIVTRDATVLFPLPLDVVAEATGVPEAGALHARSAIEHGQHVAMITKEADAAVGPALKRRADAAGVVYTAVEGDQHGMLIGLVAWARLLGLEILCGAKALDGELLFDPDTRELEWYDRRLVLTPGEAKAFRFRQPGESSLELMRARQAVLKEIAGAKPWDLVELTIAANGTRLRPDCPALHCPPCWTGEIPEMLCPREMGGVLEAGGRVDAVQVIRRPHEASLGGGVMVVVRVRGEAMREIVRDKGTVCHRQGETALLSLPHHLLGIEAIGSILAAGVLREPTGASEYRPEFDVVYRAARRLAAGSIVGHDHSPELSAEIVPAVRLAPEAPLPAGLARGNPLRREVAAGERICGDAVARPAESALWLLREEQERAFAASLA